MDGQIYPHLAIHLYCFLFLLLSSSLSLSLALSRWILSFAHWIISPICGAGELLETMVLRASCCRWRPWRSPSCRRREKLDGKLLVGVWSLGDDTDVNRRRRALKKSTTNTTLFANNFFSSFISLPCIFSRVFTRFLLFLVAAEGVGGGAVGRMELGFVGIVVWWCFGGDQFSYR